jgi:hypothetical protein
VVENREATADDILDPNTRNAGHSQQSLSSRGGPTPQCQKVRTADDSELRQIEIALRIIRCGPDSWIAIKPGMY